MFERRKKRWEFVSFCLIVFVCLFRSSRAVRPLREVPSSLDNENPYTRKNEDDFSDYSEWNLTGTYKGTWRFLEQMNNSSSSLDLAKPNGVSILELVSTPSKIHGLHYVKGAIIFHDVFGSEHDLGVTQLRMSGVFIWPFQTLRMIANSGIDGDPGEEDYLLKSPYHLLGVYSSQVLQDSPRDKIQRLKNSLTRDREKQCIFELNVAVSQVSSTKNDGDKEHYHLEGLLESPSMDYDGECFSPIALNVTSLNIEVYYSKAVNYTLMVTFISFLQVLLLIRQMEHTNTQSGAAKVSILMIGQQAIMDAYLCLLHLTAGILIESLFNAFATAAFFKFVVFSIFEMRYLLAIWKASRPTSTGEGWETMRRELSVLYSRFYGILLGGILIMYEFHNFLRPILLIMYSFWIPQIVTNVTRDTRKPLHPHYIIGMTLTRLAIPMYMFGCPNNFMHIEPDISWSIYLGIYMGLQALVLLLQHYLGSRWFIPHQILPEKYSYYRRIENDRVCGTDCVICMTSIDLTSRSSDYMVTPCDHLFHSGCLQRWMDIKMECPTCRRSLPPA